MADLRSAFLDATQKETLDLGCCPKCDADLQELYRVFKPKVVTVFIRPDDRVLITGDDNIPLHICGEDMTENDEEPEVVEDDGSMKPDNPIYEERWRREQALDMALRLAKPGQTSQSLIAVAENIKAYLADGVLYGDGAFGPIDLNSNCVKHAVRELELLGEEPSMVDGYLRMITIFAQMGHSGGSASVFIPTLNELLQFRNLKPLTNNPEEWMEVGDGVWQSRRRADAFSNDGGQHYYVLDEPTIDDGEKIIHTADQH